MANKTREKIPLLSKSRFMSGLQCHKRLYLECFHRELATPPDIQQKAIFDTGSEVGKMAQKLFPGGLLIKEQYFRHNDAMRSTQIALADSQISTIYEAAFFYDDGVHVIVSPTLNGKLKTENPYITINDVEKTLIPRKPG